MKKLNTNDPDGAVPPSQVAPKPAISGRNVAPSPEQLAHQTDISLCRPNSQSGRLQRNLLDHPRVWHRMTDLMRAAHCNVVHSAVDKLREGGMRIENGLEYFQDHGERITVSYYKYVPTVGATAAAFQPLQQPPTQSRAL